MKGFVDHNRKRALSNQDLARALKSEESKQRSALETLIEAQKLIQRLQTTFSGLQKKYDDGLNDIQRILPDFKPEDATQVQQYWEDTLKTNDEPTKMLQAEKELIDRLVVLFGGLAKAADELNKLVPGFESKDRAHARRPGRSRRIQMPP